MNTSVTMQDADPGAFPSDAWFRRLQGALERSADFKAHGRWLRGTLALRVDTAAWRLTFDRGLVTAMEPGRADADILINGSTENWRVLLEQDWTLNRVYRYGVLEIRGDPVTIMRNWKALFFIAQDMKRLAA